MRFKRGSLGVAVLVVLGSLALLGTSASAAPKVHCDVLPFTMGPQPADVSNRPNGILAEWTSTRDGVSLQCPNGIISVDVWEHAVVGVAPDTGLVRGKAQIVIEFTGAGVRVPLHGTVRGVWDDSDIVYVLKATGPQGARIELEHSGQLDLVNEMLYLDEVQGFFDIFTDFGDIG